MFHNHTFVERLRQLVAEVSELMQTINPAQEVGNNSKPQWLRFDMAVNDLSAWLNETITTGVNETLHYTAIVEANRRETGTTITQINDVITEASRLLGTPMSLELEQTEVVSSSLAQIRGQLVDLTYSIKQEENRTVLANETIHERVEYAVETGNKAAAKAQNATDTQAEVAALLQLLHENASAVNVLGEQTVGMATDKLSIASRARNHSLEKLNEASQANPDRSGVSLITGLCPESSSVAKISTL